MAFADPQTVTINAVPNTLPRVGSGPNSGQFQNAEGTVKLAISHAIGKRARRTVRIDYSKVAPDPLTSEQTEFTMSTYVVIDSPLRGLTVTEQKQIVDALTAWLTASSGANVTKVLGQES